MKLDPDAMRIFAKTAITLLESHVYPDAELIEGLDRIGALKSEAYYERTLERLVQDVYNGYLGGDFVPIMENLLTGQLTRAWNEGASQPMNEEYREVLTGIIEGEKQYVQQYYRDIVDARVDGTALQPLLNRVQLWVNRYKDVKNQARLETGGDGKFQWVYGETEHCATCAALNGVIAFGVEWEMSGYRPQNPPNDLLDCGGWNCQCELRPTKKHRSRNALSTLLDMATAGNI